MNLIWFEFEKKRLKHSLYQRNLFLNQCWTLLTYWLITTSKPRSCEWMLLPSNYPSQAGERFGPPKAQTETHSNFKGNGHTECVVWNFAISNCCRITVHNWHYVGKAKMYFRDGSWKNVNKQLENAKNFQIATSQAHFGFANIGSKMHHFCPTAIWNCKFSNETPCKLSHCWQIAMEKLKHHVSLSTSREINIVL